MGISPTSRVIQGQDGSEAPRDIGVTDEGEAFVQDSESLALLRALLVESKKQTRILAEAFGVEIDDEDVDEDDG